VNNEILAVIVSVRPRRVASDCETCIELNDGTIAASIILCGWQCSQDCVMIEGEYNDFPAETDLTIRDSAGTLAAGQSTGSFGNDDGAVSKSAYIAKEAYIFEVTDTYGDRICYRYGAGEFKITVNSSGKC
jgi:hypothetical protein